MSLKVEFKPITMPKLTVATNETRLKLPTGLDAKPEGQSLREFAAQISSKVPTENTLRGRFELENGLWSILLKHSDGTPAVYCHQIKFAEVTPVKGEAYEKI